LEARKEKDIKLEPSTRNWTNEQMEDILKGKKPTYKTNGV
jgi:hypothetical protein